MASTDPGGGLAVPVENTVRALRRLAPGAVLRSPRSPDLRVLVAALRECSPAELAGLQAEAVGRVVLAAQLRALDRATTGLFAPDASGPEAARLVRAARHSGRGRTPLRDRLRAELGLRTAALAWATATGSRLLADELRGAPPRPDAEDGRLAAELVVAAVLPRAADGGGRLRAVAGRRGFLDVCSVRVGERGFRIDVRADPLVELVSDGGGPALRALWWTGLGRVTDDVGHEYLLVAKDPDGTGVVRHWCHPRPAPAAGSLRLESSGYRGERLSLTGAARGTFAEVVVKSELTVRLGS
ncbi:hypothetical protein [Amycolatopsis australiensis]|uniref:hypothetical protein n=1 Tax=Amycolatopsis australiensis TaxID=546364 RepID=UPI000930A96D|nr:hypothetical protein [Amycolatopsis australiensis]